MHALTCQGTLTAQCRGRCPFCSSSVPCGCTPVAPCLRCASLTAHLPAVQVTLFFLLFVGGLLLYHIYLALTNQTTYEASFRDRVPYLKDLPEGSWPFSEGIAANARLFCCSASPQVHVLKPPRR